jgi:hypothetical protein
MKKLVVLDSGNIMHKSIFCALSQIDQPRQIPAVYTYTRMIIGYLKRLDVKLSDTIIIAEDFGSWRKAEDKLYKAQRKEFRESKATPEWWKEQYNNFKIFIPKLEASLPYHWIKIYNMEADDIASVAIRFLEADEKVCVSSDRDWEMLCAIPNTRIFSTITKKFKDVKDPMKVLLEKIQGDISDNLLEKPTTEAEYNIRKKIVNLLELPDYIEQPIKEKLRELLPKNLNIDKVPFTSVKEAVKKLYDL